MLFSLPLGLTFISVDQTKNKKDIDYTYGRSKPVSIWLERKLKRFSQRHFAQLIPELPPTSNTTNEVI